jgi:hypothetical protein
MEAVIPHREVKTAVLLLQDMRELRGMSIYMQVVYQATSLHRLGA